jgi:predicted metalloprotease with PDZ domain
MTPLSRRERVRVRAKTKMDNQESIMSDLKKSIEYAHELFDQGKFQELYEYAFNLHDQTPEHETTKKWAKMLIELAGLSVKENT